MIVHMRLWLVLFAAAAAWVLVLLHRGEPLAWDEVEFFRATRWIAEGRLPFRDYWEHHMPLQWLAFAPVAWLFGGGAGTGAVVALRWAQVPLWIAILAAMMRVARREEIDDASRWAALVALLAAPEFVRSALQYRVDVLGNLLFVAALVLRGRPIAFGALMSLAVLANMRLAPVVIAAALLMLFWREDERRWRLSPRALRMLIGVAAVVIAFLAYLFATGSWDAFREGVIDYNVVSDSLVPPEANTFLTRLAAPVLRFDIAAILFWLAAIAGALLAGRELRRPGPLQIALLLVLVSLAVIASTAVQYPYHFQLTYILLIPLAALGFSRLHVKWRPAVPALLAAALIVNTARLSFEGMRYQDVVMRAADASTRPGERVWDGVGYALRREPAYRYWFLPAGVRLMADAKKIEPYDLPQLLAAPPAAIVYNERLHYWFLSHPPLARYVLRHYVPRYKHLWLPGLTAAVGPRDRSAEWIVPRSGRYDLYASELLARHPWIVRPLQYGLMPGTELEIPLERLPPLPPETMQWTIDGRRVDGPFALREGQRVRLDYRGAAPAGVVVVPAGTATLCTAPDGAFVF